MDTVSLPQTGYVRLAKLIAPGGPIPVSRSTIYAWIKAGIFPAPHTLGARVSAWRVEDVRAFLAEPNGSRVKT